MRFITPLALVGLVAVAACDIQEIAQPELDAQAAVNAKSQRADCAPAPLSSTTTGEITADDCLFEQGDVQRYEDIYLVNQNRLGMSDLSGANMLTFTGEADFNAIFGIGGLTGDIFPTPVYGYSTFGAGATGTWGNSFSIIASKPVYKMWFGGQAPEQLGQYTLTTATEPSIDACENGHWVFLQGDVTFSSDISNEASCRGTVTVGPNEGMPLNFQFWYYKLLPGETLNVSATGLDPHPTLTLAAIDFATGQSALDFSDGAGDTDRSVSFTATREVFLYVEVSSAPDVTSPYTLVVDGP